MIIFECINNNSCNTLIGSEHMCGRYMIGIIPLSACAVDGPVNVVLLHRLNSGKETRIFPSGKQFH